MDIASSLGMNAVPHLSKLAGFAVALTGLTDNPTHGPCAQRGVPLLAQTSGWSGQVPANISYQWHMVDGGPIAGATEASFVPDAPLVPETAIFCVVTVPGQGSRGSTPVVFRDSAPQLGISLFDEVFDLDTGPQTVAAAPGFTGENLRFDVSGAGVAIDPESGLVSISTDVAVDGALIVVTATNSGGSATAAFQITVEDVAVEGAIPFGALTPAGAGGIPVNAAAITQGDPAGHWEIAGGMLVPSSAGEGALNGLYPLVFDNGDRLDVMIENDEASARVEEIVAVFDSLPTSARGLMVQDGDARTLGRIRLEPKVFVAEMVLEPTNWLEDADPRQSVRPVTLAALAIGGSADGTQRTENLTVQGFEFQMEAGELVPAGMNIGGAERESEGNMGLICVESPSRDVTIRQNKIWSRTTEDIILADDYRDNFTTSRQLRGISTRRSHAHYSGHEHLVVDDNHIHDCSRGVIMTKTSSYLGVRSRLCNNYIEDVYTNFFTSGYLDGLDIFDNKCIGVYASNTDVLVGSPPHASVGGGFDVAGQSGGKVTQNVTMMGNMLHIGWKRTKLHAQLGLPVPIVNATGIKFNDPNEVDDYWNIVVAFNTIVGHNICLEISAGGADENILIFNNTLPFETYTQQGGSPSIFLSGAQDVRLFNNISSGYIIGQEDNTSFFARTLDTLEGYGNLKITAGGDFNQVDYFIGDPVKGFAELTVDEALAAYVPKPSFPALTSIQKKGALGTGLYLGNGVHSAVYDPPEPVGGIEDASPVTFWDGTAHMQRSAQLTGSGDFYCKSYLFAWEGEFLTDYNDAAYTTLFSYTSSQMYLRRFNSGAIEIYAKNAATGSLIKAQSSVRLLAGEGPVRFALSYDMSSGRLQLAKNGVLDPFMQITVLARAERLHAGGYPFRVHADHNGATEFQGKFGRAYFDPRVTFHDLETNAGLSAFFAEDGTFCDWGSNGSLVTGDVPAVYIRGTASTISNLGGGGPFSLVGGPLTDE